MSKKAYVFMADGLEEVEGLTAVDLLRRGGVDTVMVSITDSLAVKGSHGIVFQADAVFKNCDFSDADALVLPGGMPGTLHLKDHPGLARELKKAAAAGKYVCAICAAPRVIGLLGLLDGQTATCYPGNEQFLSGARTTENPVEVSGKFITSRGVGTAVEFGLAIVGELMGPEAARRLRTSIIADWR